MSKENAKFFVSANIRDRKGATIQFFNSIINVVDFNGDSESVYDQVRSELRDEHSISDSRLQVLAFNRI